MANKDQLGILKDGPDAWNKWRSESRVEDINLTGADLSGMPLAGANLSRVKMSNADLSNCDLENANFLNSILDSTKLLGASLVGACLAEMNLSNSDLRYADLTKANLASCNLTSADVREANLSEASLYRAGLHNTDLRDVNLNNADLRYANINNTLISSRLVISILRNPLTDEQLSGIVFDDERLHAKEYREKIESGRKEENARIAIKLEAPGISPYNFALLLVALEHTYNNIIYLLNTNDDSLELIKDRISQYNSIISAEDALIISTINEGSIKVILEVAKKYLEITTLISTVLFSTVTLTITYIELSHKMREETLTNELERKKTGVEIEGIELDNRIKRLEINKLRKNPENISPTKAVDIELFKYLIKPELGLYEYLENSKNQIVSSNAVELQGHSVKFLANIITKFTGYKYNIEIMLLPENEDKIS